MIIVYQTFIFFLIFFLTSLSVSGYGSIIKFSSNYKYYENLIFGILIFIIIGYIFDITNLNNRIINILVFILGLYFFYIKNFNKSYFKKIFFFNIILFLGLIISKTHEDFNSYHFYSIKNIFEDVFQIGQSNIDIRLAHVSLLAYAQSIFVIPYFGYKLLHIPIYVIYIGSVFYFFDQINKKNSLAENVYSIFIISILLIKFSRLSEFGYDYISNFLIFIIFHKLFFKLNDSEELKKSILLFMLCVCIKYSYVIFFSIFLYPIFFYSNNILLKILDFKLLFLIFFLILIIVGNSFLRTGCLFYAINKTCFDENKIIWSTKSPLKKYEKIVESWAKGFYHQKKIETKINKTLPQDQYLSNFNWIKNWIDVHFFYKVFEYIILNLFILLLIRLSLTYKVKNIFNHKLNFKNIFFFLCLLTPFLLWFFNIPQFRFGFSSITLLIFFSFYLLNFFNNFEFDHKKIKIFLFICLIVFNIKSIIRINSEFKRQDNYKFVNFPWFNEKMKLQKYYVGYKEIHRDKYKIFLTSK